MRRITFLFFLIFFCLPSWGQKNFLLRNEFSTVTFDNCYTIEDTSSKLTLPALLRPDWQQKFIQLNREIDYNEHKTSSYWKKIELINDSDVGSWVVEFPDPHIEHLKVYFLTKDTLIEFKETGFGEPFWTRTIAHKNYVFPFQLAKNEHLTLYAKIAPSTRYCSMKPNVRSIGNYSNYFFSEYHLLGLYYGIILILVVYNFILGFFVHDKVHFFYCLYIICCGFFTYAEEGMAIQWLWPDLPYFNIILLKAAPLLLLYSFLIYSDRFIDLKHNFPPVRKYIWSVAFLYGIVHFAFQEHSKETSLLYILPFLMTCFSAIMVYKNGYRPARFFVLGNSMVIVSFIVFYIRIKGWIPSNVFTVYMFNYAFILEAVVLSISLADKVKTTKILSELAQKETIRQLRINEELQQKVNTELEEKVQERTKELTGKTNELQEANAKLETLKMQLYEMNSKMDINIWELKKEVKKETEARILNNVVAYEEFASIFPDKKCYEYLKELKWKDGFKCPKCGNSKYGRGNNNYTFKCTQCQHQQSVTSNTLFHSLKFPISKAFYLAYFLTRNTTKMTYEEIGTLLELNKNTVWGFDKKLKESIKTNGQVTVPEWDKLLLAKS